MTGPSDLSRGARRPSARPQDPAFDGQRDSVSVPLPKRCIFCGAKEKLTKEDFFPEWFRKLYPATEEDRRSRLNAEVSWYETDPASGELVARKAKSRMARAGDLADQTLKVVCGPCNNGWMSRLQQSAKPFLLPYIKGKWPRPGRPARKVISSWATMFAMVVEFGDEESSVVPQIERQVFRRDQQPTLGAHVYMGRLAGDLPCWFHRRCVRVATSPLDTGPPNAQLTTITLGHLMLQVYLTTSDLKPFDPRQRAIDESLTPLWPLKLEAPGHHRLLVRDAEQARAFAYRHVADEVYAAPFTPVKRRPSGLGGGGLD